MYSSIHLFTAQWFLVLCGEENTLLIVKEEDIVPPTNALGKGSACSIIKYRKSVYRAEVLEVGKLK